MKVRVVAISTDDVATLAAFHKEQELPFRLLSDPDASVIQKYNVFHDSKRFAQRVTVILDAAGVVKAVMSDVKADVHGPELITSMKVLKPQ